MNEKQSYGTEHFGERVMIRCADSWADGEWGVITGFDGEHYHVALYGGDERLIFKRSELIAIRHNAFDQKKSPRA